MGRAHTEDVSRRTRLKHAGLWLLAGIVALGLGLLAGMAHGAH